MQAVILSAGYGRRLYPITDNKPKSLIKVAGKELLLRHLQLLNEHGVEEFIVVTNNMYEEQIRNFLRRFPYKVEVVVNPEPERGNASSLYCARDKIKDTFALVMSDHVYESVFIEEALKGKGIIVDELGRFVDIEESTKVLCVNGRVEDIGKDIDKWNCYDTGFFILDADIFETLERLMKEKRTVEMSELVKEHKLECTHVSGLFWMDIDTLADLERAKKLLIEKSVKGTGDGLVSRFINRRISVKITEALIDRLTPMQATFISFIVGIIASGIALIFPPLGGLVYQLSSILDGVDGEIARASLNTSKFGGWFDSILDRYVDFSFLLALGIYLSPPLWMWAIVMLATVGSVMVSYSTERYKGEFGENIYKTIEIMNYIPGKRDERIFFIMIMTILGYIEELFLILAIVTNLRVLATIFMVKLYKGTA